MLISSYFWDGFQHVAFAGATAWLFDKIVHEHSFKKPEYLLGLVMSSGALFFLPLHIHPFGSFADRLYQFLHYPLPDWDILIFGMDWHRFFLAHSLLIPILILIAFLRHRRGFWLGFGLCIGMGSHLIWDALTCSMWTPIVFVDDLMEIRGYSAKSWLSINGMLLYGLTWFVVRIKERREAY